VPSALPPVCEECGNSGAEPVCIEVARECIGCFPQGARMKQGVFCLFIIFYISVIVITGMSP